MNENIKSQYSWVNEMNKLGKAKIPFLFILDFELKKPVIIKLDELKDDILYKFNNQKNYRLSGTKSGHLQFNKQPITFESYLQAFEGVKREISYGNSFLLNLTFPTFIESNYSLKDLFDISHAKYKLYYRDLFVVSSPETFIQIIDGKIFTYPMKGTIDADLSHAADVILSDKKETAEHYTIVDLLRNDLSMIAKNVKVNKFRYIETIKTNQKTLLQISSEIEGTLPQNYHSILGDIFFKILPAGSISGAPKKKTVNIILEKELDSRGYYTGVFGIYNGTDVDSGVMIRFIEKKENKLIYRSGSGITCMSDPLSEYKEMIDKVYVPLGRKY